jgi:hypothetical protein
VRQPRPRDADRAAHGGEAAGPLRPMRRDTAHVRRAHRDAHGAAMLAGSLLSQAELSHPTMVT